MRWPLRNQLLVPFAGLTMLSVAAVSGLSSYWAARHWEQQVAQQIHDIGRTVQDSTYPLSATVLRQIHSLSGAELAVTDADGNIAATTLMLADDLPSLASWRRTDNVPWDTVSLGGEQYLHRVLPLRPSRTRGNEQSGSWLHVLYPERRWRQSLWQAAMPPLVVGGLALLCVGGVAFGIAHRLARPIQHLRNQMERLCGGDYSPIDPPLRDDELRDLVGSANQLAAQLAGLKQTIQRTERLALLGQLSGGLAHQLRNQATGAKLAIQLHERHCADGDAQSLEVAARQLSLMERCLQRLLTIGQPAAGHLRRFDLYDVVEQVSHLIEPTCRHRKVRYEASRPRRPVHVDADAEQLATLLINLAINALEAAGDGGWVRVDVDAPDAQHARIRVSDSGSGPPPNVVERLFEPFVTGKPEGVGLGLAVARQIARLHRGDVIFASRSPTCFEVRLPLTPAVADDNHAPCGQLSPAIGHNHQGRSTPTPGSKPTVESESTVGGESFCRPVAATARIVERIRHP